MLFPEAFYRATRDISYPLAVSRAIAQAVVQGGASTEEEVLAWVVKNADRLGLTRRDVKEVKKVLARISPGTLSRIRDEWEKLGTSAGLP
jgi:hypothetical protein